MVRKLFIALFLIIPVFALAHGNAEPAGVFEFLNIWDVLIWVHVLGAILGGGAAFTSDFMFTSSIKDGKITGDELRFLKTVSMVVWIGIGVSILSGLGLFWLEPDVILESDRMLAKVSIVAIIIANGLLFHFVHIPKLKAITEKGRNDFLKWCSNDYQFFMSGAISGVSWLTVITLGVMHDTPYSFLTIMLMYLSILFLAVSASLIIRSHTLDKFAQESEIPKKKDRTKLLLLIFIILFLTSAGTLYARGIQFAAEPEVVEDDHHNEEPVVDDHHGEESVADDHNEEDMVPHGEEGHADDGHPH
ncbi:MAG: hypothetical protein R3251_00875 [Candidatus Spechtbacterales bacterium]|nr:hypothetical protein [Candidatus Spechtbacterales bacterium]